MRRRNAPWLLLLLLAAVLTLFAAGCGGDDEEEAAAPPPPAETEAPPAPADTGAPAETAEAPASDVSAALITDIGGLNDRGFNEFSAAGLEQAQEELGVDGRILTSDAPEDYVPNLTEVAEEGRDLVISVGFLMGADTHAAAEAFPDTKFAIIDFGYGGEGCAEADPPSCELPNLQGLVFPSEEAGYLAGIMAARMSETGTISSVGGIKIPSVDNWIAGYQQGAKDTNPDIKVLNAYSQDFVDQAKCKEIALEQIANGADVVFQVAGQCGLGALDAAKEQGVWGIGVDVDQSALGDHILTSALKPVQLAVFETVKSLVDGEFAGATNRVFGIQQLGPETQLLGTTSPEVPQEVLDEVEAARQKLLSGEIDPPATLPE